MTRALLSLLATVVLVALTGSTALAGKPTVAILGLEVVDPSGNIDAQSTQVAREITEGLRNRAKAGSGPYQLVVGGDKELIDEKLIHNCDTEAIPCMAEIGKNLGANYLVYGRLEKKADGYIVTINLLNVDKKKFEKAKTPLVITKKDPASLASDAKKAYNDLTGIADAGTLVVTANAGAGKVFLDDGHVGDLASGMATIQNLREGRYRLAIESQGYNRNPDITVTIRSGETTTQQVNLTASGPGEIIGRTGTTSGEPSTIWMKAFYTTAIIGAGLGVVSGVYYFKMNSAADDVKSEVALSESNCGDNAAVKQACDNYTIHKWTGYGALTFAGLAVVSGVLMYMQGSSERAPTAPASTMTRRTKKRTPFTVTPVVSPDGGGATFQIDW